MDNLRISIWQEWAISKVFTWLFKLHPTFLSRDDVDLTYLRLKEQFLKYKPDFVINTSAFTNVELAETSKSMLTINAENVKNIAQLQ